MQPVAHPVHKSPGWRVLLGALMVATILPARAAEPAETAEIDFASYRPVANAPRIAPEQAPTIDADLSDPIWAEAELIDEFYQLDPDTGQPGSERTELRILQDGANFYFAIYAYDSQPENITATILTRDGDIGNNDFFRIYFDPLMTRRDGYGFEVNAAGARSDVVIQNNTTNLREWDTIWSAEARIVEDGWVAEVMIPMRGLAYDPERTEWGFDFQRIIRHKNERQRWTSIAASTRPTDISRSGTLTGISPDGAGIGLDIQTFERVSYRYEWPDPERGSLFGRFGANAYYRITPSLTGTLTVNPDFSDAPLDERQVNTTRFQLFQPETRDFFLQDVATFDFGGYGFFEEPNGRPFFSRNVGLANGRPVAIMAGGKLSGEIGGIGVGGLSTLTSGTGLTTDKQVLSVARLTAPILDESRVGMIVTNGDPTGSSDNTVAGLDFQYQNSNLAGGNTMRADFFYERSFSSTHGDDNAFGIGIEYPNEPWTGSLRVKQIGEDFHPALGFVNRRNIRQYKGELIRRDRTLGFRWFDVGTLWDVYTDLDNELQSRANEFRIGVNHEFNQLYGKVFNYFENVPEAFDLPGDIPVPIGRYNWTNFGVFAQTATGRSYRLRVELECCRFYNGNYFKSDLQLDLLPNAHFNLIPRYVATFIDLPTGQVDIHVFAVDVVVNFTPDMNLLTQIQYDNISERFGLAARYRWEYEPGQELFVSFGQTAFITPARGFDAQVSQLSIRFGQTFQF